MKYLSFIPVVLILLVIRLLFRRKDIKFSDVVEDKIENNIIKQPKFYAIVAICGIIFLSTAIGFILFSIPGSKAYVDSFEERIALSLLFFIPFELPCIIMLFYVLIWKVEIFEDYFTYRNMFGKKKTYPFKGTEFKRLSASVRFYRNGKRILMISPFQPNWDALHTAIENSRNMLYKKPTKNKKREKE